jgi:hypothetical protein
VVVDLDEMERMVEKDELKEVRIEQIRMRKERPIRMRKEVKEEGYVYGREEKY